MRVLFEKKREWERIKDQVKAGYLLREKIKNRSLYLKGSHPPAEFYLINANSNSPEMEFATPPGIELPNKIVLYATLSRHVELEFEKVTQTPEEGKVLLLPIEARIGKTIRAYERHMVIDQSVSASNFYISKNEITSENAKLTVTNRVVFQEFEKQLGKDFPGIRIFDVTEKAHAVELKLLQKEKKPVFVRDVSDPASYAPMTPMFVDYGALLKAENLFEAAMRRYSDAMQSLLIVPIIYTNREGNQIPVAYFWYESKSTMQDGVAWKLLEAAVEIIQRIMDANTFTVKDRQKVINVSEGGVSLELDHPELVKYAPQRSWITFDIIFKMQAPMRFQGKLCHVEDIGGAIRCGLDLGGSGHTEFRKSNMERLRGLVRILAQRAS